MGGGCFCGFDGGGFVKQRLRDTDRKQAQGSGALLTHLEKLEPAY